MIEQAREFAAASQHSGKQTGQLNKACKQTNSKKIKYGGKYSYFYIKHYSEIVASKPDEDGAIPWAWIVDHNSELVPVQK